MRYQNLGWCGVCAVQVIHWVISSSTFEAAQAGASTPMSQTAGEKPVSLTNSCGSDDAGQGR